MEGAVGAKIGNEHRAGEPRPAREAQIFLVVVGLEQEIEFAVAVGVGILRLARDEGAAAELQPERRRGKAAFAGSLKSNVPFVVGAHCLVAIGQPLPQLGPTFGRAALLIRIGTLGEASRPPPASANQVRLIERYSGTPFRRGARQQSETARCAYDVQPRIVCAVSRPLASAASTVPISGPP